MRLPSLRPAAIANAVRLARAKHRKKTVRFKVGDLTGFYSALNARGIPYVVLRWTQDVPLHPAGPEAFKHDIDHLIGRRVIGDICDMASERPGRAKCDFYSVSGERGTGYRGFPYLTPALADDILRDRILDGAFYTPNPRHMFFAFAYHLVYHKGLASGLEPGFETVPRVEAPSRDYLAELRRLAGIADIALPEPETLLSVHQLLKTHGWNMPFDLMIRWPAQHEVMANLRAYEERCLAPLTADTHDINVFIVRSDCEGAENFEIVRSMVASRFDVLDVVALNGGEVQRLTRLTRGGNWFEKWAEQPVLPTHMMVCQQRATAGPLPAGLSVEKVAARYPHISHTDVLIKREIRSAVNVAMGGAGNRIILHATDNATESAETLAAAKGDAARDYLAELRKS